MDRVIRFFYIITGISLWFPSFSLINVGEGTGLQLGLVFTALIFVMTIVRNNFKINKDLPFWIIIFTWLVVLYLSFFFSSFLEKSFSSIIIYLSAIFVLCVFAMLPFNIDNITKFLKGYVFGGGNLFDILCISDRWI